MPSPDPVATTSDDATGDYHIFAQYAKQPLLVLHGDTMSGGIDDLPSVSSQIDGMHCRCCWCCCGGGR